MMNLQQINLSGIPETMLYTLHNRASESMRKDGCIYDPEAEKIFKSINYDYCRSFGSPEPSHAIRSLMFDAELNHFISNHPDGIIVNLGEGLETQRYRVKGKKTTWLSVEVPEAMLVREMFIKPDNNHQHINLSALDTRWFERVPQGRSVYITAQGLMMYFSETQVRNLLISMSKRFANSWFLFDVIPQWLSRKTMCSDGWKITKHYALPPCPWGINYQAIRPTLNSWIPNLKEIEILPYWRYPRGFREKYVFYFLSHTPALRNMVPVVIKIRFGD